MFSHTKKSATLRDEKKGFFFVAAARLRGHGRAERYDFFCHRAPFDR